MVEVAQKLSPLFVLLVVVRFVWLVKLSVSRRVFSLGGTEQLKVLGM